MARKLVKQVSLLLTLLLTMTFLTPLVALAEETPAIAIVTVEGFTIGQGFYKEPTMVGLEAGDTAYDLLTDLIDKQNIIMDGRDLKAIKGVDRGLKSLEIPSYSVDKLQAPNTQAAKTHGNPLGEGVLGSSSYSSQAKWICLVNNKGLDEKMDDYRVKDKDVIRFAFSYWGHGADITGYQAGANKPLLKMANKDGLLGAMAFVNLDIYRFLFESPLVKDAYQQALSLMDNALASQREIDEVEEALIETANNYSIVAQYKTHIQNKGWEERWRLDNEMSGTSGQSLRLEGIKIDRLANDDYDVGLIYKTHIQNKGWEKDWKKEGALSGTHGQSLRLEAIEIKLTGPDAHLFDVFYQVHAQNVGWMNLARSGEPAGTAGFGYRLEGIRIQVVPRGLQPTRLSKPSVEDSFIRK